MASNKSAPTRTQEITADGDYPMRVQPGQRYAVDVSGTFGGGTVLVQYSQNGSEKTFQDSSAADYSFTAATAPGIEIVSPSATLNINCAGATTPDILVLVTPIG